MRRSYYAAAAAFLITLLVSKLRSTPYNNYVLLADAFLHGHLWISSPGNYIDSLAYGGRQYIIEAPLPAILLLPAEFFFGLHTNQTFLAVLLCAVAIGAAWEICERLELDVAKTLWLCAFLLAGTDLLWCSMLGDVWMIAHTSAVAFTLLAIAELLGRRRPWVVALCAACAFESRFTMILALPVYWYLLCYRALRRRATADQSEDRPMTMARFVPSRTTWPFIAVIACVLILHVLYNEGRWGTLGDAGYTMWYHQDTAGQPTGSPFRLQYLPYQLQSFFIQGPALGASFPYITPSIAGVALTWTSPALLIALFARRPRTLVVAFAVAALLCAIPNLLYYVNGFAQYGMRHALDFEPFLFVLMALAIRERLRWWMQVLIAYSVAAGLYGCWYWDTYVRRSY